MNGRIGLNQTEFFGTRPEIGFIKTEDIVADEDVRVHSDHPLKPGLNHCLFRGIGMDLNTRDGGAIREDKEMLLGRFCCTLLAAGEGGSDLNDGIADQVDGGAKRFLKNGLQLLLVAAMG